MCPFSTSDHYHTDSDALPLNCTKKYLGIGSAFAGCVSYIQYETTKGLVNWLLCYLVRAEIPPNAI
jgi:hypothetical protein